MHWSATNDYMLITILNVIYNSFKDISIHVKINK